MIYQKHVDNVASFLLELCFPSFCLGCQKEGSYLCADCKSILEIGEFCYCLCSKSPIRILPDQLQGKCSRCQDKKLSGLYFALPYKEKHLTRKLIHRFKYPPQIKGLKDILASIIAEHLIFIKKNTDAIWENSILISVPMELKKVKSRGYNQAEVLAKALSKILKVPCDTESLVKIKKTLSQVNLSAKERQENLKGAFLVKNPDQIRGKKIFLVDDVYTTGSTMEECSLVLKAAGAKQVWGISIAREG